MKIIDFTLESKNGGGRGTCPPVPMHLPLMTASRHVARVQGRTVHRGTGGTCPQALGGGTGGSTAIGVPANAFTFYIYFPNGNMSEKANFC